MMVHSITTFFNIYFLLNNSYFSKWNVLIFIALFQHDACFTDFTVSMVNQACHKMSFQTLSKQDLINYVTLLLYINVCLLYTSRCV